MAPSFRPTQHSQSRPQISLNVQLQLGNNIANQTSLIVPVAFDAGGTATAWDSYKIATVAPEALNPAAGTRAPTWLDIVNTASAYAAAYVHVLNAEDCGCIAYDVGAAAGAVHPAQDSSTDPNQNTSGGFWRVVYRGTDPDQVTNWYNLLQPGDFVRMGWAHGGQHSTTIMGTVMNDGSISVYDNADSSGIGIHSALYWQGTDPSAVTIFRLTPDQRYLITGTSQGEIIQGSGQSGE